MKKKEKIKKEKKKKEVYIEKHGLLGNADDYNVYHMSVPDRFAGYMIGALGAAAGAYIFFGSVMASVIFGAAAGFFSVKKYKGHLLDKRRKSLLLQFKDLLESLNNSYSAGRNTADSFYGAKTDLEMQYGEDADIVREVAVINSGVQNGFNIEEMLHDLGVRSGLEDITSFADIFEVSNRLGGDLKKAVSESYDIIADKIEMEIEINTLVASGRNELNIMAVLPFAVVMMMNATSDTETGGFINIAAKSVGIIMILIAYAIGLKLTKIKI